MKRIITLGAIAAVTAAGLSATPTQAAPSPSDAAPRAATTKSDPSFTPAERASTLRDARQDAAKTARTLQLPSSQALRPTDAIADTNGAMHIRYDRTYRGLRVIGGDLVVHQTKSGAVEGVDAASHPRSLCDHQARRRGTALRHPGGLRRQPPPGAGLGDTPRRRRTQRRPDRQAHLHRRPHGHASSPRGTRSRTPTDGQLAVLRPRAVVHGAVRLDVPAHRRDPRQQLASTTPTTPRARHAARCSPTPTTCGATARRRRVSRRRSTRHTARRNTWDFYKNTFGRNGIKNNGVAAYSRVHYGNNYENAFWDDSCFCMTYGDGGSTFTARLPRRRRPRDEPRRHVQHGGSHLQRRVRGSQRGRRPTSSAPWSSSPANNGARPG